MSIRLASMILSIGLLGLASAVANDAKPIRIAGELTKIDGKALAPDLARASLKAKGLTTPSSQVLLLQRDKLVERTRFELATPTLRT